ncbi:replication protein RepA [Herbiconiux liukaitaii]|uniref:replication protein RepA n=1 Tax=Herbiconiux liukaitaii TaxID=3342799 RepID=UPI0035BAA9CA
MSAIEPAVPRIPRDRLKALNFAAAQEQDDSNPLVGYSARVWAQVSLPYRDPGDVPYWTRKNGDVELTMRPALLSNPDGSKYEGFAYGLLPRHALTWIATEAVRTQSPVLQLGSSMNTFMQKIGLAKGGRDAKRLTEQLQRLFGSQLFVRGLAMNESGRGEMVKYFQIADTVQLWFSKEVGDENKGLWSSSVTLSESFYRSIVDAPVPVHLEAMRALGSSPMRLDIYLWATYRVFTLTRPAKIRWTELNDQFGGQYGSIRQFKAAFIKNLHEVKLVYPELNVEVTQEFLVLRPSRPHIPPTKRRVELI